MGGFYFIFLHIFRHRNGGWLAKKVCGAAYESPKN